ncbi:uncharacterized protein LOC116209849 [Punica granatum]|uniref:Protein unc-45 homolog B n=2 Tax=Punica granatum TaxID=22663 RepID=A0A218X7J0_PUNGR|nr:uncharacterized protein LOC116209849 [Punica granatum]OWM80650.1 hypothetical protein CDL15_Pgr006680 [Punica granatum]PKI45920.1 hypothetical protein CRG98_033719 [Punica granatum]
MKTTATSITNTPPLSKLASAPKNFNHQTTDHCTSPWCFLCTIEEPNPLLRRAKLIRCFKDIPLRHDLDHVLALSSMWHMAMNQPDDPELPSLGIFTCMARLIHKGVTDKEWLLRDHNIYIPYYAAHIVGTYTMSRAKLAEMAIRSGVVPPLIELLRGRISWVEQRVAVRALGHLASYDAIFESLAVYEGEIIRLAMELARTCLRVVYSSFVGVSESKRLKYLCDLLTRGVGGLETENRKAEEWASQTQCWSLYLLNCFASKERALDLICKQQFLAELSSMWGGLVNHSSPAGVGTIRILCYSKLGRDRVAECQKVVECLCNLSRSSDDWQYVGIDCLLLLLKDVDTRFRVFDRAVPCLVDLAELRGRLGNRSNLGEAITKTLLVSHPRSTEIKLPSQFKYTSCKATQRALEELWDMKVERRNKERRSLASQERIEERRVLVGLIRQRGSHLFWLGKVEKAIEKYSEALDKCPLGLRKQRMKLYSNRGQCHLVLGDHDGAIRDTTRALCLSDPPNSHGKSLWRRSQAYDMKGMAKESLMDCVMFINIGSLDKGGKRTKIPYCVARMISKQMEASSLFSRTCELEQNDRHRIHGQMSLGSCSRAS